MNKRPLSVTIIGCVYIVVGAIGFAYHFTEFTALHQFPYAVIGVEALRLLAVVIGVYMLRGRDWARWLALAWIGFHVIVSAFHTLPELAMHALLCAILAYFLLRPTATQYFRPAGSQTAPSGK